MRRHALMVILVVASGAGVFWRGVTAQQVSGQPPGDNALLPRSYDGAPPLIPHSLDGLVPITTEENLCLFCHAIGSTDPGDPPQVPRSHFIDWRVAPGVVRDTVAGARWACMACHVVQSNAPTLVGNTFDAGGR